MANSAALSIQKMGCANKCKKRRLDAFPKAQSVLRTTTSTCEKSPRSRPPPIGNFTLMLTLHPCPPTTLLHFPHHTPQTLPHPSPGLTNPVPSAIQNPPHQTAHSEMYKENAVIKVRPKNLLSIHCSHIKMVPRDQCLIAHRLPGTRADTGSLETRHDIDELPKVIKLIVPPAEVIIILKTHRLGPRDANLSNSPRPLKVVHSETAKRDLLMKSRLHLRGSHSSIYFHVDRSLKERQKLAEARLELKARMAKGERGLTIQDLKVVKAQRPYLWHDP